MKMSELKTLKDIDIIKLDEADFCVYVEELKEEAVKWVKEIRKQNHGAQIPELLGENPKSDWIINFFNLTEEDLKDD